MKKGDSLSLVGFYVVEDIVPPADAQEEKLVRVLEQKKPGVSIAYALTWDRWFREWTFLLVKALGQEEDKFIIGTCIGGIRVETASPGYTDSYLVALANAHGRDAPRTNVVRYGLEDNLERDRLLSDIYSLYCQHIAEEVARLQRGAAFSLTWAAQEGQFLVSPLLRVDERSHARAAKPALLRDAVMGIPLIVVESNGERLATSISDLHANDAFWTIDC